MEMAVRKAIAATCAPVSRMVPFAAMGIYMAWRQEYDAARQKDVWEYAGALVGLRRAASDLSADARQVKPCSERIAKRWWKMFENAGVIEVLRVKGYGSRILGMRFVTPERLGASLARDRIKPTIEDPKDIKRRTQNREAKRAERARHRSRPIPRS